jgi:beta-lactamase class A
MVRMALPGAVKEQLSAVWNWTSPHFLERDLRGKCSTIKARPSGDNRREKRYIAESHSHQGPLMKKLILLVLSLLLTVACACAQPAGLRGAIERIAGSIEGKVGVAVVGIESTDTLTVGGAHRYPMQSVYKFPLALAVLHDVDSGKRSLTDTIRLRKKDLLPNTWSPLREKYPGGNAVITLDELITFTVAQSDNNGCDMLFRLMGGCSAVEKHIHAVAATDIAIVATEEEMHRDGSVQYRNWCAPSAMGQILRKFYRGELLSPATTAYLRGVMERTSTGPKRIKGLLPEGTVVAHKTGSSGTVDGMVAATNDVGVITLPDGSHIALVVFVSDARDAEAKCEEVIARVAVAVWDAYVVR